MDANTSSRHDTGFIAIVALVAVIAIWLLLTPVVPSIASASLNRFHLRSRSFAVWAIQFPIPTMYNFANRFEVRKVPVGPIDPILEENGKRYLNHFPARVLTFFNTRYRHLNEGTDRWVTIESSYRGQTVTTRFHAKPKADAQGFDLIRLPQAEPEP
jgi:hypothetical protein